MKNKIIHGDCLEAMKQLDSDSIDAVITDPPYELGFMGKGWDNSGIAYNVDMWLECLRVLKPGGHLLSFGGTRTYHRMACAIEDAGFEVRNMLCWTYASGFPKSLNLSRQLSKQTGIGLCTCKEHEPMIQLKYEKNNKQRDNISNGKDDGFGFGEQIRNKRNNNNEVAEQVNHSNLSLSTSFKQGGGMLSMQEKSKTKDERCKEVSESILQSGVCEPVYEKEGYGNSTIRAGLEKNQATSKREGQDLSDMQNKTKNGVRSPSLDTIQNGGKELNGKSCGGLSQLPQQDRKSDGKGNSESEDDLKIKEWGINDRFICSKCRKIKTDIGGTALKPAIEPICMAMKPLSEKNFVANVLKWKTGGINIDESRVGTERFKNEFAGNKDTGFTADDNRTDSGKGLYAGKKEGFTEVVGRFPANLILSDSPEVRECFPETKSGWKNKDITKNLDAVVPFGAKIGYTGSHYEDDNGGNASRFFKSIIYTPKASKSERNMGCEGLEEKTTDDGREVVSDRPHQRGKTLRSNNHPTVKPIALMEYLIKMICPPKGIVLDPFMGSGSTGVACKKNGYQFIGIEKEEEYVKIAEARLNAVPQTLL